MKKLVTSTLLSAAMLLAVSPVNAESAIAVAAPTLGKATPVKAGLNVEGSAFDHAIISEQFKKEIRENISEGFRSQMKAMSSMYKLSTSYHASR